MKTQVKNAEEYILNYPQWNEALAKLRHVMLETEMEECIKWGAPVYTIGGKNVVGMAAFKSYVGIWFYQGALLKDDSKVLFNAQEGKTKALRQWRFTSVEEIDLELIKLYVEEAIRNQEQGREIKIERNKTLSIPEELQDALNNDDALKAAFATLTPGCQREYAEHISDAKRTDTRQRRLDKIIPMIMDNRGLNDKYKKG